MEGVVGVEVDIYFISFVLMEHFKHAQWRHCTDPQPSCSTAAAPAGPASALPAPPPQTAPPVTVQTLWFVSLNDTGALVIVSFCFI